MDEEKIDYILGGISVIDDELKKMNTWLHKLYDIQMTALVEENPPVFEKLNLVHNELGMFMEDDWEGMVEQE